MPERSKTRSINGTTPSTQYSDYNPSGAFVGSHPTGPITYPRLSELINYDTGRNRFNGCTHVRTELDILTPYMDFHVYPASGYTAKGDSWGPMTYLWGPEYQLSYPSQDGVWDAPTLQSRQHELWNRVRPTMTTGFSALNFIHELKDFKSLIRRVGGKLNVWRNLLKDLYDPSKSLRMNLHRLHLSYAFAWAPLARDIAQVMKGMRSFHKRYNALVQGANKTNERKAQIAPASQPWQVVYNHSDGGNQRTVREYSWEQVPKLSLTAKFSYLVPGLNGGREMAAILDSLGVNLNPAIIWNAIPFSFVVDWFSNVGSYLDQYGVEQVYIPVRFELIGYSLKYRIRGLMRQYRGTELSPTLIHTGRHSYYRRWTEPFVPPIPLIGQLPDLNQALLGLSLVTVIRKR